MSTKQQRAENRRRFRERAALKENRLEALEARVAALEAALEPNCQAYSPSYEPLYNVAHGPFGRQAPPLDAPVNSAVYDTLSAAVRQQGRESE